MPIFWISHWFCMFPKFHSLTYNFNMTIISPLKNYIAQLFLNLKFKWQAILEYGMNKPETHGLLFTTDTKLSDVILFSVELAGTHSRHFLFALVDVNSKMEPNILFWPIFPENCIKMIKNWTKGEGSAHPWQTAAPLDPSTTSCDVNFIPLFWSCVHTMNGFFLIDGFVFKQHKLPNFN